jgi:hypothetical protein
VWVSTWGVLLVSAWAALWALAWVPLSDALLAVVLGNTSVAWLVPLWVLAWAKAWVHWLGDLWVLVWDIGLVLGWVQVLVAELVSALAHLLDKELA